MTEFGYKCSRCGRIFSSNELISEKDYDYPGAPVSTIYISPCCGTGYTDEFDEED